MRPAKLLAMRRVATHATGTVRRMGRSLPEPLVARLHDAVAWADQRRPAPTIEDWSEPLVGTRYGFGASRNGLTRATAAVTGPDVVEPKRSLDSIESSGAELPALRCLLVTCALDVGGLDEMVALLARRLPAYGVQTAVLHATSNPSATGEPKGRLGRMLHSQGIEVHEANGRGAQGWIERWRPDVISTHHVPDWALAIVQRIGVPDVDTLHGAYHLFNADRRAEPVRGTGPSAIVAVSEITRQQYLARNPDFSADRIVTIPNGVDDERRSGGDRAVVRGRLGLADEYLFVSLARHCLQKNTYGLVTAFGELARHHPEVHLVIAGRPDEIRYYRQVRRLRDSLPWRDRIHLRDHVAAPAELLAAADGFVHNAFFEGGPLVSMEALCAGLPVVLSDACGAREQIRDDRACGFVVANPLGDPLNADWESMGAARYRPQMNRDEFATAMEYLVAHRDDYLRDRERLAAESTMRFSASVCLARHAAVLLAVATGADCRAATTPTPAVLTIAIRPHCRLAAAVQQQWRHRLIEDHR